MKSMTGYGKARFTDEKIDLTVEIKTVNNRFIDLNPKYPRSFLKYEDLIRKIVSEKISRGRVELNVTFKQTDSSARPVVVDLSLAESYVKAYETLKGVYPFIKDDFSITALLKCPDVTTQTVADDDDSVKEPLVAVLSEALDNLNKMRETEGEKLKEDLAKRIDEVEKLVIKCGEFAPLVKENYRVKLTKRVEEALSGATVDEARLLQEVAVFADKSNIDEELTRLKSHISQFRKIIQTENSGKKLDFLVQELNREANTICSKSNDVSVTDCGLKLKCEIEKIREQIQNVE